MATSFTRAEGLSEIKQRGVLRWGADQEGGGPYVYPDAKDPSRMVGFEVELADSIARELGVESRFIQGDWNTLPELLRAGAIDLILNGYEWTPERAARMSATRPYYIFELQLLAKQSNRARSMEEFWHELAGKRAQIAVLRGTAAATLVRDHWADRADLVEYDGNTDAMAQVRAGLHDGTLADLPVAIFYRGKPQEQGLEFVGNPIAPGYYVMYARKGDERFVAVVNAAIESAYRDGRLRGIYERFGIWNALQEKLLDAKPSEAATAPASSLEVVGNCAPIMLKAAGMTVILSVASMPLAVLIGLFVALGRIYGPAPVSKLLAVYVEVLRGTPVMLQLYVLYFLLPTIFPFALSPTVAAIAGLAINYSAYESEIYRAGLQAIPRGQMEAALALGMSRGTALRRVIVPQAVRMVIPPVTNDFIALFKDTSVCSVITITELTKQYNVLANSTGAILPLATMTAILYMAMSYPLSVLTRRLEAQSGAGHAR